jgi:hypothetical protein
MARMRVATAYAADGRTIGTVLAAFEARDHSGQSLGYFDDHEAALAAIRAAAPRSPARPHTMSSLAGLGHAST